LAQAEFTPCCFDIEGNEHDDAAREGAPTHKAEQPEAVARRRVHRTGADITKATINMYTTRWTRAEKEDKHQNSKENSCRR